MDIRKIRVLIIGVSEGYGGIENVIFSWVKKLEKYVSFDFVNDGYYPISYQEEYLKLNCHVHKVTPRLENIYKHYKELYEIIKNGNYDYVHCNLMDLDDPSPYLIVNKLNKGKVIAHSHSSHGNNVPFKEKILILLAKLEMIGTDPLRISCGNKAGEAMFKNKEFYVIENGIEYSLFNYSNECRKKIRERYKIEESTKVVGHIGHSCYEKNYPFLFESFNELVKKENNVQLMMIGNINQDEEILSLIGKYGLKDKVIFTGLLRNVYEHYSAMDVFYLPSISEGLPLVLIEAQISGLKCVTSEAVTKETCINKDLIDYVEFDIKKASSSLQDALNSNINRERIEVDRRFDLDNSSNKLLKFYQDNLN